MKKITTILDIDMKVMTKIIANKIVYTLVLNSFFIFPSYAKLESIDTYSTEGKYGYSTILYSKSEDNEELNKKNWIRGRQKKIPCNKPNIVGIQSTSSALIISPTPQQIPIYPKCNSVKSIS